jgi:hypothetical protein
LNDILDTPSRWEKAAPAVISSGMASSGRTRPDRPAPGH